MHPREARPSPAVPPSLVSRIRAVFSTTHMLPWGSVLLIAMAYIMPLLALMFWVQLLSSRIVQLREVLIHERAIGAARDMRLDGIEQMLALVEDHERKREEQLQNYVISLQSVVTDLRHIIKAAQEEKRTAQPGGPPQRRKAR